MPKQSLKRLVAALALVVAAAFGVSSVSAQDPARFEREIVAFEKADAAPGGPAKGGIVFYGSSSFRMWSNLGEAFPGRPVVNRGFGGSQLSDLNHFFDRVVVPLEPRLMLVYGGDNDVAAGKTPERVLADFKELVERSQKAFPRLRVAFVSIKPSPSREKHLEAQRQANDLVRNYAADRRRVDYIDAATPLLNSKGKPDPRYFLEDRLHLNAEGYAEWQKVIGRYLERRAE